MSIHTSLHNLPKVGTPSHTHTHTHTHTPLPSHLRIKEEAFAGYVARKKGDSSTLYFCWRGTILDEEWGAAADVSVCVCVCVCMCGQASASLYTCVVACLCALKCSLCPHVPAILGRRLGCKLGASVCRCTVSAVQPMCARVSTQRSCI
jgi:hypothetical protein